MPSDAEAVRVADRVAAVTGANPDDGVVVLVSTEGRPAGPVARRRVAKARKILLAEPAIARVRSPYDGTRLLISRDGKEAALIAEFGDVDAIEQQEASQRLLDAFEGRPGVLLGGKGIGFAEALAAIKDDLLLIELITFPLLLLACLWFFRGVVAALVPPVLAGAAIVLALGALRALTEVMSVSVFSLNLVTLLALGLSIDFSLFMLSRYREERADQQDTAAALARTMSTAGRTVAISALTIAGSLAALLAFPQPFLRSLAVSGVLVTGICAVLSLVVLPAALRLLGDRIDSLSPRRLQRAAAREARPVQDGAWYRLARVVLARPGMVAALAVAALLAIASPVLGLRPISIEPEALPASADTAVVQQHLDDNFDPPIASPITAVLEGADVARAPRLAAEAARIPGVAAVLGVRPLGPGAVGFTVLPRERPPSAVAQGVVEDLRSLDGLLVGGQAALALDERREVLDRLPLALLLVIAVTLLLVFLLTGSVLIPLVSVLLNLLTVAACFGVLTFVLQDGRLEGILDYTGDDGLTLPTLLFIGALAFGLSTDYGVFVLSRIKEARDRGATDQEAVGIGLERTGRLVTAAALLFVVAVGAFAAGQVQTVKEVGIGLAVAVALDAVIVRSLLVPSLLALLDRSAWWAPGPLARLHARAGLSEVEP
ncbi:MAG TPA: MMPL family transporter [Thermoleophilaceae bacterium]